MGVTGPGWRSCDWGRGLTKKCVRNPRETINRKEAACEVLLGHAGTKGGRNDCPAAYRTHSRLQPSLRHLPDFLQLAPPLYRSVGIRRRQPRTCLIMGVSRCALTAFPGVHYLFVFGCNSTQTAATSGIMVINDPNIRSGSEHITAEPGRSS